MHRIVDRRALLARGAAATAALAETLGLRSAAAGAESLTVYRLDPGDCVGCQTCNACRGHAANKFFASFAATDGGRAHPGCDCGVVEESMARNTWTALFGAPQRPRTESVDKRHEWVQAVLES
ncbi:MAG: hypothetical protein M3R02_17320 [Chloroflexota bacterium]|nr:hypothetical protein [Chloroflexota bacterium]